MQISRFAAVALDEKKQVELIIDFLPELNFGELQQNIQHRLSNGKGRTAEELFIGLFNHKLTYILLKEAGIDPEMQANKIKSESWKRLANLIKGFALKITDTNGFENAQTCTGGVPLSEVDLNTMESKRTKGLYFAGELLDVDGTCGGYNLQWAWSTGYLAGKSQK